MMASLIRRIARTEPAPPWGPVTALGVVVGAFVALLAGTVIVSIVAANSPTATLVGWSIGMVAIALYITVVRNRTPEDGQAMRIGPTTAPLLIYLLLGLGVGITLDVISLAVTGQTFPVPELLGFFDLGTAPPSFVNPGILGLVIAGLFLMVIQPVGEALVFHGVAYPALRANLGIWAGFFITALFYAVFHLVAYSPPGGGGNFTLVWYTVIVPFLDGIFLTTCRAVSGSTRAVVAAHVGLGLFALIRAVLLM